MDKIWTNFTTLLSFFQQDPNPERCCPIGTGAVQGTVICDYSLRPGSGTGTDRGGGGLQPG